MPRWPSVLLSALLALPALPSAKGIRIRFLASPEGDSVSRYDVYRSAGPGAPAVLLGSLPTAGAAPGDTLSYPDATAEPGTPYGYALRAVDAAGGESEPSDTLFLAMPRLALPDTAAPGPGGATRIPLPAAAHPLRGLAPLRVFLPDSTRFRVVLEAPDSGASGSGGALLLLSRSGRADTGRVVVRAGYFGRFEDADSLLVIAGPATAPVVGVAPGGFPPGAQGIAFARSGSGGWTVRGLPEGGSFAVYAHDGRAVGIAGVAAPAGSAETSAFTVAPGACASACLLVARDRAGRVRGRLALPPRPGSSGRRP